MKRILLVGIKILACCDLLRSAFLRKNLFLIGGLSFYLIGISAVSVQADNLKAQNDRDAEITVVFSKKSERVGFTYKNTGTLNTATVGPPASAPQGTTAWEIDTNSQVGKKTLTATITPASEAVNIDITEQSTNGNRLTIVETDTNTQTGVITFTVYGKSATPQDKPEGDTFIVAKKGTKQYAKMSVVVIVPAKIGSVTPLQDVTSNLTNTVRDSSTAPPNHANFRCLYYPTKVACYADAFVVQSVTVFDQFDAPLDQMYNGVAVTENNGDSINQSIINATYSDPYGLARIYGSVDKDPDNPSSDHYKWLHDPALSKKFATSDVGKQISPLPTTIQVEIGGHAIGGLTRRMIVTFSTTTTLTYDVITWSWEAP